MEVALRDGTVVRLRPVRDGHAAYVRDGRDLAEFTFEVEDALRVAGSSASESEWAGSAGFC
jgi:hypothetical protein